MSKWEQPIDRANEEIEVWKARAKAVEKRIKELEAALSKIASCEKRADGDVVDIARAALEAKP